MRILVAAQQIGHRWSGLGTYATNLVEGLIERGIDATVMCPASAADCVGARTVVVELGRWARSVNYWMPLAYAFGRMLREIGAGQFDLVHFADAREALFAPRFGKCVGTMNDYYAATSPANPVYFAQNYSDWPLRYPYYQFMKAVEPMALARLDGVVANSRYVERVLIERYGVPADKLAVINYGIASGASKIEELDGDPSVLFVGANYQRKGLPHLLRAAALLRRTRPGIIVHVFGADPKERVARQLSESLGIASSTVFHGQAPNARVRRLEADMFVMPSLVEGFGIVFLEAMAKGIPVIGGAVGGTLELIRDDVNGFVVAPGDVHELARRMEQLAADGATRKRLVKAGLATVAGYSVDLMVDRTVAYYEKIVAGR
ncbi:MAG: glycosyltransferase family 4 protein [Deltaproteobacteria bacterium]|nr:glycosyltransferase family 4 protein [Deltaproteobacteria bacterium]